MKLSAELFVMLSALFIAVITFAVAAPASNAAARPLIQGPEFMVNEDDYNRRSYFPSEKRMDDQFLTDFPGDRFEWKLTRL